MVEKNISPEKSWIGFETLEMIRGSRKAIVALIGSLITYLFVFNDQEILSMISGIVFAMIYTALEFYFNKVKLK